ncbi:MAG: hypothetical protein HC813_02190 [Planctomycetes bacterium]|nr:hypothetical protein [Planctomycetota bacterium]
MRIEGCDASFNSGWGIALWRSSGNLVQGNRFDWCVRGYSHGIYDRGQDSAGILVFEQSSGNRFLWNSATHGGDGFFLYAGHETTHAREGAAATATSSPTTTSATPSPTPSRRPSPPATASMRTAATTPTTASGRATATAATSATTSAAATPSPASPSSTARGIRSTATRSKGARAVSISGGTTTRICSPPPSARRTPARRRGTRSSGTPSASAGRRSFCAVRRRSVSPVRREAGWMRMRRPSGPAPISRRSRRRTTARVNSPRPRRGAGASSS